MNEKLVDQIVNAVLYEGYILYPYRASAKKNRQRFTFGRVYPEAYSVAQNGAEPCMMQTECLVEGRSPTLEVKVRFLHPMSREIGRLPSSIKEDREPGPFEKIPELRVGDKIYQSWQEAVEREVDVQPLSLRSLSEGMKSVAFEFPQCRTAERIFDAEQRPAGAILRRQEAIEGLVEIAAETVDTGMFKITARIINRSLLANGYLEDQDAVLMRTLASTHTILRVGRNPAARSCGAEDDFPLRRITDGPFLLKALMAPIARKTT